MRHDSKPPGGASKHISKGLAARASVGVLCLAEVGTKFNLCRATAVHLI